jgi:hypothetical protein
MLSLNSLRNKCVDGSNVYEMIPNTSDAGTERVAATKENLGSLARFLPAGFYLFSTGTKFDFVAATDNANVFLKSAIHTRFMLEYNVLTDEGLPETKVFTLHTTNSYLPSGQVKTETVVYIPENIGSFSLSMAVIDYDGPYNSTIDGNGAVVNSGAANCPKYIRNTTTDYYTIRRIF